MRRDLDQDDIIVILSPIIGGLLLAGSAVATIQTIDFVKSASRTEGTITWVKGAHAQIEFTLNGKDKRTFSQSGFFYYPVGDRVPVLYRFESQNPAQYHARIDTPVAVWHDTIFLAAMGIGFLGVRPYMKYNNRSK